MSIIEIKNVYKVFGDFTDEVKDLIDNDKPKQDILEQTGATMAVKNVNLSIEKEEVFVIMGLSGSGKSTLIRMINRLIPPTLGEIIIKGKNIANMNEDSLRQFRRENISMVFQSFALYPFMTVLENAAFGLEVKKMKKKERNAKAKEALQLVGLAGYEHQYPAQLSGGMQQRVGLARALANDTDILLMDEAFSALDPLIRKDMQNELIELQKNMKKTIVFITHDLDEALHIGDKIALMKDGVIAQVGRPVDIINNPANEYVKNFVKDVNYAQVLQVKHVMHNIEDDFNHKFKHTIESHRLLNESFQFFKEDGVSEIGVIKDENIVGVLHFRDVFKILNKGNEVE